MKSKIEAEADAGELQGLTELEAQKRFREEGPNELPQSSKRSVWSIAFEVVREPMFLLLAACGALYLVLGDKQEAAMLLGFVLIVMGITVYQERKTERALEALRDLSSPRALVVRDGAKKRIAGGEVVRGDVLILAEGDRVPADARLRSSMNLSADESLLTGESVPVRKAVSDAEETPDVRPGGDDLPYVFSGTLITQGQGFAEVLATGARTEIGKIGKSLQSLETDKTLLQTETARLVKRLALLGLGLCGLVVVAFGVTTGDWLRGILAGITMAMATLPEEFPVVLTIFLAMGAWRISQKRVLTRRVPAVEMVGATTVLCTDKTGTLTQNRMQIGQMFVGGEALEVTDPARTRLPEKFHELVEYGILASKKDPFDPMERELRQLGTDSLSRTEHIHGDWTLLREYPLSRELLALSQVWQSVRGKEYVIAAKGAPEAMADLCHFSADRSAELSQAVGKMADCGLRVLGVARARFQGPELPTEQHAFAFEFLGLVGFSDPIRPSVPAAIQLCYQAGIRVIMITGDYPGTARFIAQQVGLSNLDEVITGSELNALSDEQLRARIAAVNIFARVVPEQKLRIVQALKANNEIVAMTGDGVNDAPALKAAHIGIAMGGRGTDVARESASLVLLDDDFSSIVAAIRMGRRTFDNLKKAMAYIFAVHVPIVGMSLIPVLFKQPLVLFPVHVLFLELIIDPSCSVVFEMEGEEPGVMKRKPRNPNEPLFSGRLIGISLLQGVSALIVVYAVYALALSMGRGETQTRALAFTTMILSNLALIVVNRSWTQSSIAMFRRRNSALWWVLGGAAVMLSVVLFVPFVGRLFKFAALPAIEIVLCLAAAVVGVAWFELAKIVRARRTGRGTA